MSEKRIIRLISAIYDAVAGKKMESEFERSLAAAGEKGGDAFLRELRAAFAQRTAQLREQLAAGIIDKAEFRKQSDLAAKAFNDGLLKSIQKARAEGKLTDQEYTKLAKNFKRVGDEGSTAWTKIKGSIVRAGLALAAYFSVRQIVAFGKSAIAEASNAEAVWSQLAQTLDGVGVAFADVEAEINGVVRAMERSTTMGDEEVAKTLQNLVLLSGDYAESLRNVGLVADIAAAKNIGFEQASDLVGKALAGNSALLVRMFPLLKGSSDVLGDLAAQLDGQAEKARGTWAGAIAVLGKEWGNFKEAIGTAMIEAGGGTSVLETLIGAVKGLTHWVEENQKELQFWVGGGLKIAFGLIVGITKVVLALSDAILGLGGAIVSGAIRPFQWLIEGLTLSARAAEWFWRAIGADAQADKVAASAKRLDAFADSIRNVSDAASDFAKQRFGALGDLITGKPLFDPGAAGGAPPAAGGASPAGGGRAAGPGMLDPVTVRVQQSTGTDKGAPVFGTGKSFDGILTGKNELKELEAGLLDIKSAAQQAAGAMSNAFQDAFARIGEDGFTLADGIQSVFAGMAGSALKAVSDTAKTEAAKEFAYALSMAAHALGFGAFGNLASAGAAAGSATQHVAAGLAWTALAGASGAGASALSGRGGHGRNSLPDGRDAGVGRAANTERAGPEINLFINPWDPTNPMMQRSVAQTNQYITDRFGPNAKVTTRPYPGAPTR